MYNEPRRVRDKWEIEEDLRVLRRAEEIKRDTTRYADAKALLKEQMAENRAIMKGGPPASTTPGRKSNPATIGRLYTSY